MSEAPVPTSPMRAIRTAPLTVAAVLAAGVLSTPGASAEPVWSKPVQVPGSAQLALPRAAVNPRGDAVVAWADARGRVQATVRDHGRWSSSRVLARGADGVAVRGVQVAIDRRGTALVAWAQTAGRSPRFRVVAARRPAGGAFGAAQRVGTADSVWRAAPQVAFAADRSASVAWSTDRGVVLRRRPAAGRWSARRLLRGASAPSMAYDPRGVLHVAFQRRLPARDGVGPMVVETSAFRARSGFGRPARVARRAGLPRLAVGADGTRVVSFLDYAPASGPQEANVGAPAVALAEPHRGYRPPQRLSGTAVWDTAVAAGPHGQAIVTGDAAGGGSPVDPARPTAWVSARPAGGAFSAPLALSEAGPWVSVPSLTIAADGTAVVALVRRDPAGPRTLSVTMFRPAEQPPAPVLLTTFTASPDVHNAWFGGTLASAGREVLLVGADQAQGRLWAWSATT